MPKAQTIKLASSDDAVLLIHGLASSPLEMFSLATTLKQRGFSVEVPHIRGFGFGTEVTCCEDWLAQIVELTREMLHNPATINLARKAAPAVGITQAVYPVPQELKSLLLFTLLERGLMHEALVFTRTIGMERKAARLRYLRNRWAERLMKNPKIVLHTPLDPALSCAIGTVQIKGVPTGDVGSKLWDKQRILATPIIHPEFEGLRVTPNEAAAPALRSRYR